MTKYQQALIGALRHSWQNVGQIRQALVEDGVVSSNYPKPEMESHLKALANTQPNVLRFKQRNEQGKITDNLFRRIPAPELAEALKPHWQTVEQIHRSLVDAGWDDPRNSIEAIEEDLIALSSSVPGMARRTQRNQSGRIVRNLFRRVTVTELDRAESRRASQ